MAGIWHSEWASNEAIKLLAVISPVFALFAGTSNGSGYSFGDSALAAVSAVGVSLSVGYIYLFYVYRSKFKSVDLLFALFSLSFFLMIGDFSAPLTTSGKVLGSLALLGMSLGIFKGPRFA